MILLITTCVCVFKCINLKTHCAQNWYRLIKKTQHNVFHCAVRGIKCRSACGKKIL